MSDPVHPLPQSPADSHQLLQQQHPLHEQLYREQARHEITQANLRAAVARADNYAQALDLIGQVLENVRGGLPPFEVLAREN